MDLSNKVAVVTGASAGIGAAIARALSAANVNLVLTARREDLLTTLARDLPNKAAVLAADITDPRVPAQLLALAHEKFGRADIIINNAGVLTAGPIETLDLDDASAMIRINFEAVMRCSYVFAKEFKKQKSGAIINVSSIGAFSARPFVGVYSATKHAVEGLTTALRLELAGTGVKVGTVVPGSTATDMMKEVRASAGGKMSSLRDISPNDIAQGVVYMLTQPDVVNIPRLLIYSADQPS